MNTSLTGTDKTSAYLRREAELEQDALIDWAHDTISREAANL